MGDGVHVGAAAQQLQNRLDVDARGSQQGVCQRCAAEFLERTAQLLGLSGGLGRARLNTVDANDLTHERVAVGVHAGGRQAQDHVAGADVRRVEHLGTVDDAHGKSGKVVVGRSHDAGVLGHLAAHERAARELAAVGHTLDDLCHVLGLDVADGNVVQEEQRLGARSQNVVDAHSNQVLAHRLVTVHDLGEHELGAHAVGTANQNRVFHILKRGSREQATKATDAADDLGTVGVLNHLLNSVNGAAALGGIDAGILIRHMLAVAHLSLPLPLPWRRAGAKRCS